MLTYLFLVFGMGLCHARSLLGQTMQLDAQRSSRCQVLCSPKGLDLPQDLHRFCFVSKQIKIFDKLAEAYLNSLNFN